MGDISQDDLARMFYISRFKVSRILRKCREMNIVEFRINKKPLYFNKLESQLRALLDLHRVFIAPPGTTSYESKRNVGKVAAKYLLDNLKDGMTVGFDWGTTLQTMIPEYVPDKAYPNSLFVQISGSIVSQSIRNAGYMDGYDIVKSFAAKAKAEFSLFTAPYIVKDKLLRDMLLEEPYIKRHVDLFETIDLAFFGVGSSSREVRLPFYLNYLTPEEFEQLETPKVSGEIFSKTVSMDGKVQENLLSERILTIDLVTLKKIPDVVVLASGIDKVHSIIAGAKGKYFSTLIIDEIAALSIIDYFDKERNSLQQ